MPFVFLLLFFVLIAGNSYVTIRVLDCFPSLSGVGRTFVWVLLILPIVFFILNFLLSNKYLPYSMMRFLYLVGSSWLFFILYMVIGLLIGDILKLVFPLPHYYPIFLSFAIGVLLGIGYWNYDNPKVREVPITLNKKCDIQDFKVVAISDIHLGYGTTKSQLKRYIKLIEAQSPDIILIGGDLIDNSVVPLIQENMIETLSLLKAPLGVFLVPGNHEYISGIESCQELLSETNLQMLKDSVVILSNGIQIIGRDDRFNKSRVSLEVLMQSVDKNKPTIVLDHQPFEVELSERYGVDLMFCGHTHRGQIWPISLITDMLFDQSYGYRLWGDSHVYVSSGLSLWGAPFRIGTDSELVVLNISSIK